MEILIIIGLGLFIGYVPLIIVRLICRSMVKTAELYGGKKPDHTPMTSTGIRRFK